MELMVTLAIAMVLATLAAPSFNGMIISQQIKSSTSDLYSALIRARSEAIKRNGNVAVTPVSKSWQNGWQIADQASGAVLDNHGALTRVGVSGPESLVFQSSGRLSAGAENALELSSTQDDSATRRCVLVDLSGRPLVKASPC